METLILRFKSKKNYKLIKELASQLEDQDENSYSKKRTISEEEFRALGGIAKRSMSKGELPKQLPKSKFKSTEDFLSFAGSMKGKLISKEHLRSLSWKKRV